MFFSPQYTYFTQGRAFLIVPLIAASESGMSIDTTCKTFNRYAEFMQNIHYELSMLQVMLRRGDIIGYGQAALDDIDRYMATVSAWKAIASAYFAPRTWATKEQQCIQRSGLQTAVFSSSYAQDQWIKSDPTQRLFSVPTTRSQFGRALRQAFARDFVLPDRGMPTFTYFQAQIAQQSTLDIMTDIESAWRQCGYPMTLWDEIAKPACASRIQDYKMYADADEAELSASEVAWVLADRWDILFPERALFYEYASMPYKRVNNPYQEQTKENHLALLTQLLLAVTTGFLHDNDVPCGDLGQFFENHIEAAAGLIEVCIASLEAGDRVTDAVLDYLIHCFPHITLSAADREIIHQRYTTMYLDRGDQVHGFDEVFMRSHKATAMVFHYQGAHSVEWGHFFTQLVSIYPALQPTYRQFSAFLAERNQAFSTVVRTPDNILIKPSLSYQGVETSRDWFRSTPQDFFQYSGATQMALLTQNPSWVETVEPKRVALPLGQLGYRVQDLLALDYRVEDLRLCGFSLQQLWGEGVSIWQLYQAQYPQLSSIKRCFSIPIKRHEVEVCVNQIQDVGGSARKLAVSGISIPTLRELHCSVADFCQMGLLPAVVYEAMYPDVQWMAAELAADFFSVLAEAYKSGVEQAAQRAVPILRGMGYSVLDLCQAGFSAKVLRETCHLSLWQFCTLGFRKNALKQAGFAAWRVRVVKSSVQLIGKANSALPPSSIATIRAYQPRVPSSGGQKLPV